MAEVNCSHTQLKVVYLSNEEGSIQLEICQNRSCTKLVSIVCEHVHNDWIPRNTDPEEQSLICRLCGADGT